MYRHFVNVVHLMLSTCSYTTVHPEYINCIKFAGADAGPVKMRYKNVCSLIFVTGVANQYVYTYLCTCTGIAHLLTCRHKNEIHDY